MKAGVTGLEAGVPIRVRQFSLCQLMVDFSGDIGQSVPVEWLTMDGRQGGCMPFQYGTKLKNLIQLGAVQFSHKGASVGLGVNEPFGTQASERVTNRGARNAGAVGQFFFQQAFAGLETAADDQLSDGVVGKAAGARHGA